MTEDESKKASGGAYMKDESKDIIENKDLNEEDVTNASGGIFLGPQVSTTCRKCGKYYPSYLKECPNCGAKK